MKTVFFITALFCIFSLTMYSQFQDHPTIDTVQVSYKPAFNNVNTSPEINVVPQITITLKQTVSISKIYVKILNTKTNDVLYQVNYSVNLNTVLGEDGTVMFSRQNNELYITHTDPVILNSYRYELYTENEQGQASTLFSIIQ